MNLGTFLFFFFVGIALASDHQHELRVIAHIESNSGKNLNHPVVTTGMHKGHQAAGHYGLMPLTVIDLVSKSRYLKSKFGYILTHSPSEITEEINHDPQMDKEIASFFWRKLRKEFGPKQAAFAWYHGPGKARKVEQSYMEQTEYVVKFTKEMERINNETTIKCKGPVHISATR